MNQILEQFEQYAQRNNLTIKRTQVFENAYFLTMHVAENEILYRHKFCINEYKSSVVIYNFKSGNAERYDIPHDKLSKQIIIENDNIRIV